jgi:hypothetical protein
LAALVVLLISLSCRCSTSTSSVLILVPTCYDIAREWCWLF